MQVKTVAKSIAALAVSAAFAAPAFADTVILTDYTYPSAATLSVGAPGYSGGAGQFTGLLNGNSFLTYCTEIGQNFSFNTLYTYSVVSGVTAWGAATSTALDRVLSGAMAAGWPSNATQSAVVQAAVWEVLYETSGTYSFAGGTFIATGTGAVQTALDLADPYWASLGSIPITVHADQLFNPDRQNFLVMTAVPEPGTYAMMLAGLGLMGVIARRRNRVGA